MRSFAQRLVVRETLLALLVLALSFLNFGHTNLAIAADGHLVVTGASFCGDPLTPADGDHTPCHACRIGNAADLPLPPAAVVPVVFAATPVAYAEPLAAAEAAPLLLTASPRAPPLA